MRCFHSAFSLVELSIVLAILGVLTAGGLSIGTSVVEQQANVASNTQLDSINQALQDYFKIQRRLPCPANRELALGATGFGTEAGICNAGAALTGTVSVDGVHIGALPVRALGLRDRSIADEFGNRYIYAVTERHTNDVDFLSTTPIYHGMISVIDGSNNPIASGGTTGGVSYIVISAGNDGKGALRYQTGGATPPVLCGASTNRDVENCNNDATFRDARFNNGSVAANFFDDFVRWMPKFRLNALSGSGGGAASLWSNTGDNIYSVGNDGSTVTGNVGIGTTAPAAILSIANGANDSLNYGKALQITNLNGNRQQAAFIRNGNNVMSLGYNGASSIWGFGTGNTTDSSFTPNFLAFDMSAGTVGIGTINPGTNRLFVEGGTINAVVAASSGAGNAVLGQHAGSQRFCYLGTSVYALQCGTADSNFQGRVGILSGVDPAYGLTVGGNILAAGFFSPSDERLKTNIHPAFAENALELLQEIHAVHFTWKKDGRKDIGVIAQEVEKVIPEAVNGKDDEFKQVAYDKLILPVIEAVKELYARFLSLGELVSKLETRIDRLEKENQELKQRLERLEKHVGAENK